MTLRPIQKKQSRHNEDIQVIKLPVTKGQFTFGNLHSMDNLHSTSSYTG